MIVQEYIIATHVENITTLVENIITQYYYTYI